MINLKKVLKQFNKYKESYPNNERINLKVAHMMRVMDNSIELAKSLNLSKEDIALAGLIGILHDIGRFEQVKRYDTFVDKDSIDHAQFSSELLFKEGLIRNFIEDDSYDAIIKTSIENHSKFEIDKDVNGKELLHSKIIRDADKSDIYVEVLRSDPKLVFDGPYNIQDEIDEKVLSDFLSHKCVRTEDMKCKADDFVRKCALIYGLYFPQSLVPIKEKDLISKLTEHFRTAFQFSNENTYQTIDKVRDYANTYIENQIRNIDKEIDK